MIIKHPIFKKTKKYVPIEINGTSSSTRTFQLENYLPHKPNKFLSQHLSCLFSWHGVKKILKAVFIRKSYCNWQISYESEVSHKTKQKTYSIYM